MFVKKLVEKASFKKPGGIPDGLKPDDINPRLVFHYGIPSGSILLAFESIHKILAVSTKDGRIKLFGKDGAQALLDSSSEAIPSKFLQFMENEGILININAENHIEVWDVDAKRLAHVHDFEKDITSFMVIHHTPYMFVGDSGGNVAVLKLDREDFIVERKQYHVPFSASRENSGELVGESAVSHILAQPLAESKRVIIIYSNGMIILWSIQESKAIFKTGGTAKEVTAASWACPFGSKLVVGYKNGEILVWNIPTAKESSDLWAPQSTPICKLNLGYKLDNIAISKLKWSYGDGKASRLYVIGSSDVVSANLTQVVLINEHMESRTIKLGLNLPEPCTDLEIVTSFSVQSKQKSDHLLLLGKSGNIYMYDDSIIERYLLQSQSKSSSSLPKQVKTKLPFADSNITVSSLVTDNPCMGCSMDMDNTMFAKDILPLFPFQTKLKDSGGFSKAKNLYITGHGNGTINFWDVSCPLLSPVVSVTQQNEDDLSLSGVAITALYFSFDLRLLVSGDQNGTVRVYKLKSEAFAPENSFLSLPGGSKKGTNHIIKSVKLVKVNGAVLCINPRNNSKHLAVGSDQGYVSLIDMEGPTGLAILYQKHIKSEICTGVISVQFETCSFHGFEKNVLIVATKDSSVLALESDTGNVINSNMIRPNTPSRALFMQILEEYEMLGRGSSILDVLDMTKGNSDNVIQKQQGLLLCSERAVYVYSLSHVLQSVKKVFYKKKFPSSSLCSASTFKSPEAGLILLFSTGKIEMRSLPELSLLKDISVRGLTLTTPKANSSLDSSVCFSHNGDLIVVCGDQEAFFVSVSLQKETYRFMESASRVYDKDLVVANGGSIIQKEKKKGMFSSFIKDNPGVKANNKKDPEGENTRESIEELSTIFSVDNFPSYVKSKEKIVKNDDFELDIDDIDIEDHEEKPKGNSMMGALNKKKFTSTFQAIKGKWKHMKVSTDKTPVNTTAEDDKGGAVDEIKKKYGYASTSPNEQASFASTAKIKLGENLKKLQGISLKTTEMQDSAQSFSNMAKEVLRIAENDKRSP